MAGITIRKITATDKGAQRAQEFYMEAMMKEERQTLRPVHLQLPLKVRVKELMRAAVLMAEAVQPPKQG